MSNSVQKSDANCAGARVKQEPPAGALVVGGDHPGLGIVRSLGRRGIPVYVLDDQYCISSFSRYATRVVRVDDLLDERKTVDAVLELGRRFNLRNWVLFPTRDETVAAFSRYRAELSEFFRVTTGEWASIQWAWDKKKTYELATTLDIPCPKTFNPKNADELTSLYSCLPLAIKPAIKENFFYATGAKAWRADTAEELNNLYDKAARQIKPEEILIQEIIPGDGREQYSYCAFVRDGRPHSTLTARRARQRPREFGRSASYVETVELPEIEELSERFLRAINYHGLVEIEFKRDPRDGKYKLLDVNARAWGFHRIGPASGVDFPYLLFADQMGLPVEQVRANAGVGWLRLLTDIPTAFADLADGTLSLGAYFRSLRATRVEAVFSWDDPLPFLAEMMLLPYLIAKRLPSITTWRNASQRERQKQKAMREPEGNFNDARERIAGIAVRRRN
jgi:predicted ATP-grasp superfamily ATP-dependent carboligase